MIARTFAFPLKLNASRLAAFFCAAFLSLAETQPVRADQTDDIVSATLDAFIMLGPAHGFNITEGEKKFVAPFVSCLVRGRPVVDCSKETIISLLPESAQPVARCVAKGTQVSDCAIQLAPEEMQAALRCTNELLGKEDTCIRDQLIKRIPDERTRNLAICMSTGASAIECAAQFGQGDAANALSKIGGRGSESIGKPDGIISNVVGVVAGIQSKDFGKVLQEGGEAVAKLVARTALNILTAGTPFVNYVAGDIIDAVIEHRVDVLVDVFVAVRSGDPGKVTSVIINAYYTMFAVVPCTAMRTVFPIDAVPDALCGLAGKIFDLLSRVGGGAVGEAYDALVTGLKGLGVFDFFGQVGDLFDDDAPPELCRSPMEYFTKYQMQCVRAAVTEAIAATTFQGPEQAAAKDAANGKYYDIVGHVHDGCRVWFEQCYDGTATIDKYCKPLIQPFESAAEQTAQGIYDAGRQYGTKLVMDSRASQRDTFCLSPGSTAAVLKSQCAEFLRQRFTMLQTPGLLFVNARDDADELVHEHRFRKCTPSNYQMSSASSAEVLACSFIDQQVANLCRPVHSSHLENRDILPDAVPPHVKADNDNRLNLGMTGEDAVRRFGKTHMTATSILERAGQFVERPGPAGPTGPAGGIYTTGPGINVSRGVTVRETVRNTPSVRGNSVGPAPTHGGAYSTAPNPQILIQRQQTIPYQQRTVIPQPNIRQRDMTGSRTTTFRPPANVQKPKGGVSQTAPGAKVKPSGGKSSTGAGGAQKGATKPQVSKVKPPAAPDKRIQYGSGSSSPPPKKTMKLN